MRIKGVIFDLDGVIVTTDNFHYKAWKKIADEEGIEFNREINNRLRGVSRKESLEIILEKSNKLYSSEEKSLLLEAKNSYYKALLKNLKPSDILPGVIDTLKVLKDKGIKTAVGSSSKNAPFILEQIKLHDCFDVIVSGNDIKNSKPNPEVFLLAAERLNILPENCLVVEDAEAGIEAALNGGLIAAAIGDAARVIKLSITS